MDGTDDRRRRVIDELREPKEPRDRPDALRWDGRGAYTRFLRHRSGFPPAVRAAIRDASVAACVDERSSPNPEDDRAERARLDVFRQTVRTAMEDFMYGRPSTAEVDAATNDGDDDVCTKEQLEVVLRSYSSILPRGTTLPQFFTWCPLYRLIRCRERYDDDKAYRELLSVVGEVGVELGGFEEYNRNYIGMICLVEPSMRLLEQLKRNPREDMSEAFSETYDAVAAVMMEALLGTPWMDSRDVADFSLLLRLVFNANRNDCIDSRLRFLIDAEPSQLHKCLRNCCNAPVRKRIGEDGDGNGNGDEHLWRFERVFRLGMRRCSDRPRNFGSLCDAACRRFGTEPIHRMVCEDVSEKLFRDGSARDPREAVASAAAAAGSGNPELSRAVVYMLLRRDPVAVLATV